MRPYEGRRVLLVVSGGVAAYKTGYLVRDLRRAGAEVDVVLTAGGQKFVGEATFEALARRRVHTDLWERPLAHVELGREADLVVVAPATADLLARMATGRADDLASTTLLAADAPVLTAPAMNTRMWENPATRRNLDRLRERGVQVVGPEHGELAEGEVGAGRMAEPRRIFSHAGRMLERESPLGDRRVVVTAGPTREPLDEVRYLGNRSSGRMGFALAASAWRRGAQVDLITGPASVPAPEGPNVIEVERSAEMLEALRETLPGASLLAMAAAVSDYGFGEVHEGKIKRAARPRLEVTLESGPDLLEETRQLRDEEGILTLGFALESDRGVEHAAEKLDAKGLELIALNEVGSPEAGFEVPTNQITLLQEDGTAEEWPVLSKEEVADRLLDRVEEHLDGE